MADLPKNRYGKPFDEFDATLMNIGAKNLLTKQLGEGDHSYSVYTESGKPLCGYYSSAPVHQFQTLEFA